MSFAVLMLLQPVRETQPGEWLFVWATYAVAVGAIIATGVLIWKGIRFGVHFSDQVSRLPGLEDSAVQLAELRETVETQLAELRADHVATDDSVSARFDELRADHVRSAAKMDALRDDVAEHVTREEGTMWPQILDALKDQ